MTKRTTKRTPRKVESKKGRPTGGRRKAGATRRDHEAPPVIEGRQARRIGWIFLGVMALATLVFFASFVTDPGAMLFGTDMIGQAYQSRAFAVQEIQAGRGLPQWNPFVYGGLPYLSILPYPVYYPSSLLYFVIPLHRAIGWAFVLHFLLAGVLAYGLARELKLAPGAAAVAGVAYMFTGYLVSHLYAGQDGRMFAMTWTPALFLLAERAITRRRIHWFLWMAGVVALQVFTPHVQMMVFAALAVAAYVAFRLIRLYRAERDLRTVAILFGAFAAAYMLAGLIALVEIWPTLGMVQFSHRAERGYAYASSWAMPVRETLGVMWPAFQGTLETYWGTNLFKLHTEYLGAVPILLAVVALTARRTPRIWFFAALAAGALLFAWGGATPVHRLFYETLPMMKSFRAPGMMFSVVALSAVVLAACGAQALYDQRAALADPRHPLWKAAGGLGAMWVLLWLWAAGSPEGFYGFWTSLLYGGEVAPERAAAMAAAMEAFVPAFGLFTLYWAGGLAVLWGAAQGRIAPLAACGLLAALTLVDLWRVDRKFYDILPVARLTTAGPTVEFLQDEPEPYRVLPLPDAFGPNDLMLFRIPAVTGSQNFRLRWWDDLVGEDMTRLGDSRIWQLLNIQYLVSGQPLEVEGLDLVHEGDRVVYASTDPSAGAWIVHAAVQAPANGGAPATALLEPAFDPRRQALLAPGSKVPSLATPPAGQAPANGVLANGVAEAAAPESVEWIERSPDRLVLDVRTPADGLLVLSEIYHPYWRATVDGAPAQVLQVNVALRGVPVTAGRHRVAMSFRDPKVTYGAWGSLAGLALWIGALACTWRRRDAAVRPE
ncbi:MAG TPA: hypothetical protein VM737_08935 [Gemmatimonadota bacterium]|nr:hypothetical protein [Gemmatimonadota bacterium]